MSWAMSLLSVDISCKALQENEQEEHVWSAEIKADFVTYYCTLLFTVCTSVLTPWQAMSRLHK